MSKNRLTIKQELFALEYIQDFNATRAYKKIYTSCSSDENAQVCSSKLLAQEKIRKYIYNIFEGMKSSKIADAEEVMEYLTKVLRGESESEIVVVEGTGEGCSSARKITKAPDEKERTKAAELIGKRYGIFTENFKSTMTVQILEDLKEDDPIENNEKM